MTVFKQIRVRYLTWTSRGTRATRAVAGTPPASLQDIYVGSPRHGARGEHAMASEEHKMAFAEHARKGGAGLRFFLRSTEAYRPRRKNIMNSIFRQNVFAKNNVLQITYIISPRRPQRFMLFYCLFLHSACTPRPILEFKFQTSSFFGIQIPLPEPV